MWDELRNDVAKMGGRLIAWRRELHRHPEVALKEEWTSAYLREHFKSLGLPVKKMAGTGLRSRWRVSPAARPSPSGRTSTPCRCRRKEKSPFCPKSGLTAWLRLRPHGRLSGDAELLQAEKRVQRESRLPLSTGRRAPFPAGRS